MKRLMILVSLVSIFTVLMVPPVFSYSVQIFQNGSYSYSNGGEFTLVSSGLSGVAGAYTGYKTQGVNTGAFNFETFCIEYNEHFNPGVTYYAEINPLNRAITGDATAGYDTISKGTAWLYQEFIKGTLTNYNYNGTTIQFASRSLAARDLQLSFWFLEDEGQGSASNYYADLAIDHFTALAQNAHDDYTGTGVGVLNVWTDSSKHIPCDLHQDQLIGFPVPEPTSILLLGLGLLGLGLSSRKLRK